MANADLKEMDERRMDPSGRGLTNAGRILGIIAVCLIGVGVLIWLAIMAVTLLAGASGI